MKEIVQLPRTRGEEVQVPNGTIGTVTGYWLRSGGDESKVLVTHPDSDLPELTYYDEPYRAEELLSPDELRAVQCPGRRAA